MNPKQRISYFPLEKMDAEMRKEMERCRREGTPRRKLGGACPRFRCFLGVRQLGGTSSRTACATRHQGAVPALRFPALCNATYCGNQRSIKAAGAGVMEDDIKDLLNFEKSTRYSERQKAALAYAEAITWRLATDDALWERMHRRFSEPELVELGCFIALTMGQQSWYVCLISSTTRCSPGPVPRWRRDSSPPSRCGSRSLQCGYWAKQARKKREGCRRGNHNKGGQHESWIRWLMAASMPSEASVGVRCCPAR